MPIYDQETSERDRHLAASRAALRRRQEIRRRRAVAILAILAALIGLTALGSGGTSAVAPRLVRGSISETSPFGFALLRARETAAIPQILSYTPYISQGTPYRREVALTFDDGPGPYTGQVVRTLLQERAPGTFFVVGDQVATFHQTLLDVVRAGFPIGDHTFSHPYLSQLSPADQRAELDRQAQAIASYGVPSPTLFRPPYGSFDHQTLDVLRQKGMLMVLWTVDTEDYRQPGVAAIAQTALAGARPGAIILMHDAGGDRSQTVSAIPQIVRGLRQRGFRLVTVPRLILDDPPPRDQPLPDQLAGG